MAASDQLGLYKTQTIEWAVLAPFTLTLLSKSDSAQSCAPACNCNNRFKRANYVSAGVYVYFIYSIVVAFHRRLIAIHGVKLDIQGFGLKRQEIGSCNIVE
jgi:hypothetical protein